MSKLIPEEEYLRLFLFRKSATDAEIAETVNANIEAIGAWRRCRGLLKRNPKKKTAENNFEKDAFIHASTPMEKILTPTQCKVMRMFLRDLLWTYQEAKKIGLKMPDIAKFIKVWREVNAEEILTLLKEEYKEAMTMG